MTRAVLPPVVLADPPREFGPSKGEPKTAAGLIVGADGHFVSLNRYKQHHLQDDGTPQDGLDALVSVELYHPRGGNGHRLADAPAGPVWLRVVRTGKGVSVLRSGDREE